MASFEFLRFFVLNACGTFSGKQKTRFLKVNFSRNCCIASTFQVEALVVFPKCVDVALIGSRKSSCCEHDYEILD